MLADRLPNGTLTALADHGHYHHLIGWPWLLARAAGHDVETGADRYVIPEKEPMSPNGDIA
jgi:hypothetical protein